MPRYAGGSYASTVRFSWQREQYTPTGLQNVPTNQIKKEYTRLRDIAMKRLNRLAASKYAGYGKAQEFLHQYAPRFQKIKDIPEKRLRSALADLRYFLESPYGSVSGYRDVRRKQLQTLQEHGYDFVNEDNLDDFQDFMQYVSSTELGRILYSPQDPEFFEEAEEKGLDKEQMKEEWLKWKEEQVKGTNMQNRQKSGQKNRQTVQKIDKKVKAKSAMVKRKTMQKAGRKKPKKIGR